MPELIPVLTPEQIETKVMELAQRISADYRGREPVLIGVLKGAFLFLADLCRRLTVPVVVDFVRLSSYGSSMDSSGRVHITKPLEMDIRNKDVIVVEDIVDSGLTLGFLLDYLKSLGPASVALCAMIDKTERKKIPIPVDYLCHTVEEGFLVGYGLDCDEKYRNLPGIYALKR